MTQGHPLHEPSVYVRALVPIEWVWALEKKRRHLFSTSPTAAPKCRSDLIRAAIKEYIKEYIKDELYG
jgi:hypothetical protein